MLIYQRVSSVVAVAAAAVVVPPFHHGQHVATCGNKKPGTGSVACTGGILFSFRLVEQQMAGGSQLAMGLETWNPSMFFAQYSMVI